jgi:hypothetical protein
MAQPALTTDRDDYLTPEQLAGLSGLAPATLWRAGYAAGQRDGRPKHRPAPGPVDRQERLHAPLTVRLRTPRVTEAIYDGPLPGRAGQRVRVISEDGDWSIVEFPGGSGVVVATKNLKRVR